MHGWARILGVTLVFGSLVGAGCGDDDDDDDGGGGRSGSGGSSGRGGGGQGGGTAGNTEGGSAGDMAGGAGGFGGDAGDVERGHYLVNHVAACIDCHTPRNPDGSLDMTRWLGGNPAFADLVPEDDEAGLVPAPNLTPHATGLLDWSDEQIKQAFLNGEDADGEPLVPIMPYYVFHNMTDADADAIVAYLRSLDPVDNEIPDRQPLPFPVDAPAPPVPVAAIPETALDDTDPNFERAQNGRYLAGMIGVCMECHTAESETPGGVPIDVEALFAGGRIFPAAAFGLPVPPFPAEIFSRNITPHAAGIADWTPEDVAAVLLQGVDAEGDGICPPMPAGPMMAFGGLTEADALDIGHYLTTIPPVESEDYPECTPPPPPGAGGAGGTSGAGGGG